jgi:CheY-like chemotaxis protein
MSARILIVEDNAANLALMDYLLRAFGYVPLQARDGEDGVACALRDDPDLILMDVQLPKLTGLEALQQIRARAARRVPIVAVTAFAMVGDRERVLSHGFDGYMSKPITPETFVAEVEAFLPPELRAEPRQP